MVYSSEHPATAVLEVLVHAQRPQLLRDSYLMLSAMFDDHLARTLSVATLPAGWNNLTDTSGSRIIGDTWFDDQVSVALLVPSVILRRQFNVLLNPEHPDWPRVTLGEPEPFIFDPRLIR